MEHLERRPREGKRMEATHESGYKAKFFLLPTLSWLFVFIFLAVNENLTFWA